MILLKRCHDAPNYYLFEAVPKCQILEQLPRKNVVLQALGQKTTGFGRSSLSFRK
jgi:hypothetical protein